MPERLLTQWVLPLHPSEIINLLGRSPSPGPIIKLLQGVFCITKQYRGTRAPKVSVIMPCHNYGKWLNEAVKSALNSDRDNLEVIIVDDASDDKETIRALDNINTENKNFKAE